MASLTKYRVEYRIADGSFRTTIASGADAKEAAQRVAKSSLTVEPSTVRATHSIHPVTQQATPLH